MTLFQFFLAWKNRIKARNENAYITGYSDGFNRGIQMASEMDKQAVKRIRESAIDEALERLHGNNKKIN